MSSTRLRVTVAHRPPFVFVGNNTGTPSFSGLLVDLLNKILATSAEKINYDIYVSPTNAGGTLNNGKWTGVIGELVEGRADVALFPLTRTAARLTVIDCTFSYLDQGLGLLVRDGMTGPGPLSVLAPFATTLWVTLLFTVVGVALLFWALDAYGRWIRARQTEALRASGVLSERQIARVKKDDGNPVLLSFVAAAGAPERPGRASWGVQVMYVVYCFFCLIVLSAYTANLTSYLAVRRADLGITGLQDIARDNGWIGVNPNGSTAAYFLTSQDTQATQLQPHVRYCATDTCLDWLRDGTLEAFVSDLSALEYIAEQQPCDTTTVGDPFGPGNLVIGLVKNSTWTPLFNSAIQSFSEDGTLTSLRRAWFDGLSQCDDAEAALSSTRLTISQMLGAFVFLLAGIIAAFVTGTIENLKWCLARAYTRSFTEPSPGLARGASTLMRLRTATLGRLSTSLLAFSQAAHEREAKEGLGSPGDGALFMVAPRVQTATAARSAVPSSLPLGEQQQQPHPEFESQSLQTHARPPPQSSRQVHFTPSSPLAVIASSNQTAQLNGERLGAQRGQPLYTIYSVVPPLDGFCPAEGSSSVSVSDCGVVRLSSAAAKSGGMEAAPQQQQQPRGSAGRGGTRINVLPSSPAGGGDTGSNSAGGGRAGGGDSGPSGVGSPLGSQLLPLAPTSSLGVAGTGRCTTGGGGVDGGDHPSLLPQQHHQQQQQQQQHHHQQQHHQQQQQQQQHMSMLAVSPRRMAVPSPLRRMTGVGTGLSPAPPSSVSPRACKSCNGAFPGSAGGGAAAGGGAGFAPGGHRSSASLMTEADCSEPELLEVAELGGDEGVTEVGPVVDGAAVVVLSRGRVVPWAGSRRGERSSRSSLGVGVLQQTSSVLSAAAVEAAVVEKGEGERSSLAGMQASRVGSPQGR